MVAIAASLFTLLLILCVHRAFCYAFSLSSGGGFTSAIFAMSSTITRDQNNDDDDCDDQFRIGYLSDIEGHWEYFLECVHRSNVLDWEDADDCTPSLSSALNEGGGKMNILFKRLTLRGNNTRFVYGGDTVDKGPGDIRLVRALVNLKRRYPDRVHLLVGNRDLNKLRLPSELSVADMNRDIDDIPGPFWDPSAKTLREHLEEIKLERGSGETNESVDELNSKAERLRYMLKYTLGCPDTFEFRREEIKILTHIFGEYPPRFLETHDVTPIGELDEEPTSSISVTDDAVVDSFLYEISKDGSLHQYLKLSQIGAVIGNTIFVHGAIDSLTMKFVPSYDSKCEVRTSPPKSTDGSIIDNVHEWVESLNEFLAVGLTDFDNRLEWNNDRTSRGGEALLAIQNRPAMWGRSVVCNSYADGGVIATKEAEEERKQALQDAYERLDPIAFEGIASNVMDPVPATWLLDHGIQRIVVGHKPSGDCPAVLSSDHVGVEIVSVDTSYAGRKDIATLSKFGNARGNAIAIVEITGPSPFCTRLETSGLLADGTEYNNKFPLLSTCSNDSADAMGDPYLGKKLTDGWWIKAAIPPNYHLCRGSGRVVEYSMQPMQEIINKIHVEVSSISNH